MNCEQCLFFKGYDWHDGSLICSYFGGEANCPYKIEMTRYTNYDDLLKKWQDLGLNETSKIHKVNAFNHFIQNLPIADVAEVKHGEWIHEPPYYAPNGKFLKGSECSNCHSIFISDGNEPYSDYPWCCECGARMDGKVNKSATMPDNYNFEIGM